MWLPLAVGLTGCAGPVTEEAEDEAQIESQAQEQEGSVSGVINPNQAGEEDLLAVPSWMRRWWKGSWKDALS